MQGLGGGGIGSFKRLSYIIKCGDIYEECNYAGPL